MWRLRRPPPSAVLIASSLRRAADVRDAAGPAGGDVAEQLADHPLGEVVGLDASFDRQLAQPRRQTPVTADDPPQQALVGQMVDAAGFAVSLAGGVDQRQAAGLAGGQEPPLERDDQGLGHAGAHESTGGHGPAVADQGQGLVGRTELIGKGA